MNDKISKNIAIQDIPLGEFEGKIEDALGVSPYVEALSEFIQTCGKPMTIAIQGDWGTGKTSTMRLIEEKLGKKVYPVWFNTWQYSQFSLDEELPMAFLSTLVDKIDVGDKGKALKSRLNEIGKKVLPVGAKILANALAGGAGEKIIEKATEAFEHGGGVPDMASAISDLRSDFSSACQQCCDKHQVDRIVVFVDDLDRIRPTRAVELLEILKMFLDVPHCVFVLALDYEVVRKGLKAKFDVGESDIGERSFFDKIIQLPFTMPTATYTISRYLSDLFNQIGMDVDEDDIPRYQSFLENSVGTNPRSTKRLINVLTLMNLVEKKRLEHDLQTDAEQIGDGPDDLGSKGRRDIILFSLVCLQQAYQPFYQYLCKNIDHWDNVELLCEEESFGSDDTEASELAKLVPSFAEKKNKFLAFMKAFRAEIDENGDGDVSREELRAVKVLLGTLSIASVESIPEDIGSSVYDDEVTWFSRRVLDALRNKFKSKDADEINEQGHASQLRGEGGPKSRQYWMYNSSTWYGLYLFPTQTQGEYRREPYEVHLFVGWEPPELRKLKLSDEELQQRIKESKKDFEELGWEKEDNDPGELYFRFKFGKDKLQSKEFVQGVAEEFLKTNTAVQKFTLSP